VTAIAALVDPLRVNGPLLAFVVISLAGAATTIIVQRFFR
jgi:hypothetical protein